VPDAGLDEEKLGALLRWGTGLQGDVREEVAAAGRAIVMLVEEIERLHVLLWSNTLFPRAAPEPVDEPEQPLEAPEPRTTLFESLRSRLRRTSDEAAAAVDAGAAGNGDGDGDLAAPAPPPPPSTFGE
jgi:hypothetical protein